MPNLDPIPNPEEATYPTSDAAIDALFQHGRQNGYCVKLKRTKPDGKPHKTKYFYICDRGGTSRFDISEYRIQGPSNSYK